MFTGFATLNRNPQACSRRLLLSLMIFVALFAFRGLKPMDGINVAYFLPGGVLASSPAVWEQNENQIVNLNRLYAVGTCDPKTSATINPTLDAKPQSPQLLP